MKAAAHTCDWRWRAEQRAAGRPLVRARGRSRREWWDSDLEELLTLHPEAADGDMGDATWWAHWEAAFVDHVKARIMEATRGG